MEHLLFAAKNKGFCECLTGKVLATMVFVSDIKSSWTILDKKSMMDRIRKFEQIVNREASSRGVSLELKVRCLDVSIPIAFEWKDSKALINAVAREMGYSSEVAAQEFLEKSGYCAAPFMYILNKDDRSYARMSESTYGSESAVIFAKDKRVATLCHEFYHIFGAQDYYYPEQIQKCAKKYFPNSIMLNAADTSEVDDLTAYLVGWTDTLTPVAQKFLRETAGVSEAEVDAALQAAVKTGNGTRQWSNGSYVGDLVRGRPHGHGVYTYDNGNRYDGEWKNGSRHGCGTFFWTSGVRYEGYWNNGVRSGAGALIWDSGDRFIGLFQDSKRVGPGIFVWADGTRLEAFWKDDCCSGHGVKTWPDGRRFEGMFDKDSYNGYGVMTYPSGERYEGEWVDDHKTGQGTYYFSDGSRHEGAWLNGKRHGSGVYTWSGGDRFVGVWNNDKRDGPGIMVWNDGTKLEGCWKNDLCNGHGVKTWPDGNRYEGDFIDGHMTGYGNYYLNDGSRYEGQFLVGKFHGKGVYHFADGRKVSGVWENGTYKR